MRPGSGGIYSDHKMMEGKGEKMHQKGKMKERKNKMMRGSGSTTSPMTPPVAPIQTN